MIRLRRWTLSATMGTGLLALASCGPPGEERLPTFPVSGTVLVDGKPAANATVILHPASGASPDLRPRGKSGPDGSFRLTTYDGNDGAPVGEYKVTVEQWLGKGDASPPVNRLPARYASPTTSGLAATVAAEPTSLKSFELKSRP